VIDDYIALDSKKLLECFMVPKETPLLQGLLQVMRGRGEAAREGAASETVSDSERSFHSGGMRYLRDLEEEILALVEQANS
jgi:hypothetical protein